jgi:ferredoxin
MKVIVDASRCDLHGECVIAAPEVFEIEDDRDDVTVIDPEPGEHLRSNVEDAVLMCPVAAISLED